MPSAIQKRWLELGSAFALGLVLICLTAAGVYYRSLNHRLVALMEAPSLTREQRVEVHRLLRMGASIHTERSDGYNLLMLAARNRDEKLVRRALVSGISVNSRSDQGTTPLSQAAISRDTRVLKMLLEAGAEVDARDAHGRTALMWAAWFKSRPAIVTLLDHGADITARNANGETLLTYVPDQPDFIRWLKGKGALQ
jgi:ankyrin repeat protein